MNVTPDKMTQITKSMERELAKASRASVRVGLPKEKVSGVYDGGLSVIEVGAIHEYGTAKVPRRSFLRVPFKIKEREIERILAKAFELITSRGLTTEKVLGLVGTKAANISKGAFTTKGYGQWKDISQAAKDAKGSSQPLIDTGTLRRAITYVVDM